MSDGTTDGPAPNANGGNGDDQDPATGRFLPGNKAAAGHGNPHIQRLASWREALVEAVSKADVVAVLRVLKKQAKAGERWAVCELLDRYGGRATTVIEGEIGVLSRPMTDEQRARAKQIAERADALYLNGRAPTAVDSNGQGGGGHRAEGT